MTPSEKLKRAILDLVDIPIQIRTAKIISVDKIECTCSVLINDVEFPGVMISPIKGNNGLMMYPKIGSIVFIGLIENTDKSFVALYSEVDLFEFNKGENGGLVIIKPLTDKINTVVDALNTFIDKYNSHTHTVSTSGTAVAQTGTAAVTLKRASKATKLQKEDYENTKVKH